MKSNYLYLAVDFISVLFPLAFSFYPKANFSRKWKYLWPAVLFPAVIFIAWDMVFTHLGVWGFNPRYVVGIYVHNLPVEEVLFFIFIPYSCVFIYEVLNHVVKRDVLAGAAPFITIALVIVLITLGFLNLQRIYTSSTFLVTALLLMLLQWKWKVSFLGKFYFAFMFILIPFLIVNGILTGSFIDEPVVWYNPNEIIGTRIGTIPVEDTFYGMLLLLINVSLFQRPQKMLSQE